MREIISGTFIIFVVMVVIPILVYFCVKFGTVAFYKAKQFIREEERKRKEEYKP